MVFRMEFGVEAAAGLVESWAPTLPPSKKVFARAVRVPLGIDMERLDVEAP